MDTEVDYRTVTKMLKGTLEFVCLKQREGDRVYGWNNIIASV